MVQNPAAYLLSGSKANTGLGNSSAKELPNSTEKVPYNHNGPAEQMKQDTFGGPTRGRDAQVFNGDACMIYLPQSPNNFNDHQEQ